MAIVYAVVNQKGGVGKTTTAVNVAACLALAGKRVLLADLDPQGQATSGVGVDKGSLGGSQGGGARSMYDVLINEVPLSEAVVPTCVEGLFLVPSNIDLAGAELELMARMSRETGLARALAPIRDAYDFVILDAPPALGLLTLNALTAADAALVPIQCEYYALEGVSQLMKTMDLVRRHLNANLKLGMVVLTMFDPRAKLAQQVVDEVRQVFGDSVAKTVVPRNVRLSEAPSHGLPVALYDARSKGAVAYHDLTEEVLRNGTQGSR